MFGRPEHPRNHRKKATKVDCAPGNFFMSKRHMASTMTFLYWEYWDKVRIGAIEVLNIDPAAAVTSSYSTTLQKYLQHP
jgi:hypothetical protein